MTTNNPLDRFEQTAEQLLVEFKRLILFRQKNDTPNTPEHVYMTQEHVLAALEAAAVELVNSELTDFWTSLTPDENIMRAAENYQKFCDRINALGDSHDHQ